MSNISVIAVVVCQLIAYDITLWFLTSVVNLFFRDIKTTGTFNIPHKGPVVFVIAPHANQFVDPIIVMSKVKEFSGRRISFLIAANSYRRRFIGLASRLTGSIPVERAQDMLKKAQGEIYIPHLEDGKVVLGRNTKFTRDCSPKGLIGLGRPIGNAVISEIISDTKLILKEPFSYNSEETSEKDKEVTRILQHGSSFKTAPHIDNHEVFNNVFDHLINQGALGIFPEGGSHDRPSLLPFKPGVAIMALGAAAKSKENIEIRIVPVGLNYFHPHKFRSRAVVEFGKPVVVNKENGDKYSDNPKKEVAKLLDEITLALKTVTVTCDDYGTLMALQAARRLYTAPNRESLPLPLVIDMNRKLVEAYQRHEGDPAITEMKNLVQEYNSDLQKKGLRDHQIEALTRTKKKKAFSLFIERLFKMLFFMILSLPGFLLFCPVFLVSSAEAKKRQKQALASSTVKMKAKDVLGSWKILVALCFAPLLYLFYSFVATMILVKRQLADISPISIFFLFLSWSVITTYASLRVGEICVDYYKSLIPLFYSLVSSAKDKAQIEELKKKREHLQRMVTDIYNRFDPHIFDEYDSAHYEEPEVDQQNHELGPQAILRQVNPYSDLIRSTDFEPEKLTELPLFSIPGVNDLMVAVGKKSQDVNLSLDSDNGAPDDLRNESAGISVEEMKQRIKNSILEKLHRP